MHLPWGQTNGRWATSEETAYPYKLCELWAHAILDILLAMGAIPCPDVLEHYNANSHRASQVTNSQQPRGQKVPPLVKEFKQIVRIQGPIADIPPGKLSTPWHIPPHCSCAPPLTELPCGSRVIRSHNVPAGGGSVLPHDGTNAESVIGIPWTPDEFLLQARTAEHPRNLVSGIPVKLRKAIDNNSKTADQVIGAHRSAEMGKWYGRMVELKSDEEEYKSGLPGHCSEVLRNKRLCLFHNMLQECSFGDLSRRRHERWVQAYWANPIF